MGWMGINDAADQYGFSGLEQQYGLPSGYLKGTLGIESGDGRGNFNPNADNGVAKGGFQFVPSTARSVGVDPMDMASATEGAARMAGGQMRALTSALGRPPTAAEVYLTHQQGPGIIQALAHPDEPASNYVKASALTSNNIPASVLGGGLAARFASRFEGGNAPPPDTALPTPSIGLMAGVGAPASMQNQPSNGVQAADWQSGNSVNVPTPGVGMMGQNARSFSSVPMGLTPTPVTPMPSGSGTGGAAGGGTATPATPASWKDKLNAFINSKDTADGAKQAGTKREPPQVQQPQVSGQFMQHQALVEALARQMVQKQMGG